MKINKKELFKGFCFGLGVLFFVAPITKINIINLVFDICGILCCTFAVKFVLKNRPCYSFIISYAITFITLALLFINIF